MRFTSDSGRRARCRRAGRKRAEFWAAQGYPNLQNARAVRSRNAELRRKLGLIKASSKERIERAAVRDPVAAEHLRQIDLYNPAPLVATISVRPSPELAGAGFVRIDWTVKLNPRVSPVPIWGPNRGV